VPDVAYGWKNLAQLISVCREPSGRPI
jgi:hypothetical protein